MENICIITRELVDAYLEHVQTHRGLTQSTLDNYREEFEHLLTASPQATPNGLGAWVAEGVAGNRLAPSTRNRRLVILRGFMRYLVAEGHLTCDPTASIKKSRVPRTRTAALTVADLRRLLGAVANARLEWVQARDRLVIYLLFYTGLRVSELVALNLDQVDLDGGLLRAARRKGGHLTDEHLPAPARRELGLYLELRPKSDDGALLLASHHHGRPTKRAIQKRLNRLGELAGVVARVHPHALRHAHATALDELGESITVIQDSLNHSAVQTTRRYIHTSAGRLRAARDRLPDLDGENETGS